MFFRINTKLKSRQETTDNRLDTHETLRVREKGEDRPVAACNSINERPGVICTSLRGFHSCNSEQTSVSRIRKQTGERERVRIKEVPRSSGRWGGGVGAGEFTLSSFPGFIFRAPSTKLLEISLVLFSSDNATLAARAKGWFNEKTCALYPVGRMRWKGGRERKWNRQWNPRWVSYCSRTVVTSQSARINKIV